MNEDVKYMVFTSCLTYNHGAFIEEAMNGFTIQQTNFPVVYCIIDDASTDNNAKGIESYVRQNFTFDVSEAYEKKEEYGHVLFARHNTNENCWFAVILLKENHYSKRKPKGQYTLQWRNKSKYVALCEGDDYWTDSMKLQKQVEILEDNPDCSMVCNRTKLYSEKQNKFIGEQYCISKNGWLNTIDVINRTGLYISTCSIIYRGKWRDEYPDYCKQCLVGDYPLQIFLAMKGKVGYIDDIMSVYRMQNSSSWSGHQVWFSVSEPMLRTIHSVVTMFEGFQKDYPKYSKCLKAKIANQINRNMPLRRDRDSIKKYIDFFKPRIKKYSLRWKLDFLLTSSRLPKLRYWNRRWFLNKYENTQVRYQE